MPVPSTARFQVSNLIALLALLICLVKFSSYFFFGGNTMASSSVKINESFREVTTKEYDIAKGKMYKFFTANGEKLSFKDGLYLMEKSQDFRKLIKTTILSPNYPAVFWEFPPVSQTTSPSFEFIIKNSPSLSNVNTDFQAFKSYFTRDCTVASFLNLGGDAHLVAPCPITPSADYAHLSSFLRSAGEEEVHGLLIRTAQEMTSALLSSQRTVWLSTSGLGVYYLHVRLDSFPKYYTYTPYRDEKYSTD